MSMLSAMSFTLQLDRPADEEIMSTICPGGYCLNQKSFDFNNVGFTPLDGNKLRCEATRFDYEFFKDVAEDDERNYTTLSQTDVQRGRFSEFFVFNGEHGDEPGYTDVLSVEDLEFEFEDGSVIKPSNNSMITKSANENLALEITQEKEEDLDL